LASDGGSNFTLNFDIPDDSLYVTPEMHPFLQKTKHFFIVTRYKISLSHIGWSFGFVFQISNVCTAAVKLNT
jgi:hypothetical protein